MKRSTLFVFYTLIIFMITGGFSGILNDRHENPEAYGKLLELLLDVGKFKSPINHNSSLVSDNHTINFFFIQVYNNSKSDGFSISEVGKGLNEQCLFNKDCRDIPYSICLQEKCSCKPNYLAADGRCLGLIKEACEKDSDCGVAGSSCQSGFCGCITGYYSPENSKCLQFAKGLGDFCEDNQGCFEIKHSICSNNSCECKSDYQQQGELCLGLINSMCSSEQDCAIKNSICKQNSCQCPEDFYLDGDTCYEYAKSLDEVCQSDEGCKYLPYTSCTDGHCLCLANYDGSSGTCLGMINATCNDSSECYTSDAICNETCQCPENYYFEDNHCYKFSDRPYMRASSAQACQHLANTVFAAGRCECLQGYYYDANHCYPIPLDYDTPVDTAKACDYLPEALYDDGKCYMSINKLHETCLINQQCNISFSECSSKKCKCKSGYIGHNNTCYALENRYCESHKDCPLIWFSCISGTCQRNYNNYGSQIPKPEATAVWDLKYANNLDDYSYFISQSSRQNEDSGNLAWVKNYTLDRIVAYESYFDSSLVIWCRTKTTDGELLPGRVEYPGDGLCKVNRNYNKFSTSNYEVYIDLG